MYIASSSAYCHIIHKPIGEVSLKGQYISIEAMQSHMISQPVISLKHNFTIIYEVYNWNGKSWTIPYNNVCATAMFSWHIISALTEAKVFVMAISLQ